MKKTILTTLLAALMVLPFTVTAERGNDSHNAAVLQELLDQYVTNENGYAGTYYDESGWVILTYNWPMDGEAVCSLLRDGGVDVYMVRGFTVTDEERARRPDVTCK